MIIAFVAIGAGLVGFVAGCIWAIRNEKSDWTRFRNMDGRNG